MLSNEAKIKIANAIVERLWLKGYITKEEKEKVNQKNKKVFSPND